MRTKERELGSIERNKTWTRVQKPRNTEILNTRWEFLSIGLKEKKVKSYKVRLMIRGFAQKEYFNYEELYIPVGRVLTLRMILSVGNRYKY